MPAIHSNLPSVISRSSLRTQRRSASSIAILCSSSMSASRVTPLARSSLMIRVSFSVVPPNAMTRPLWSPAFLFALDRHDEAVALEHLDRVVESAEVQSDELVVMALAHRGGKLVGVHRPLVEKLED